MEHDPILQVTSPCAVISGDNVDTDQIIPSREIKGASRTGLSAGLFANQRYKNPDTREPDPQFVLNIPPFDRAEIILCERNFGCGSSREHAVWALKEFGVKIIFAESFGEIFFENCINNGIAPIEIANDRAVEIRNILTAANDKVVRVDLETLQIEIDTPAVKQFSFSMRPSIQQRLTQGLDAIGLTAAYHQDIADHIRRDQQMRPWVYQNNAQERK